MVNVTSHEGNAVSATVTNHPHGHQKDKRRLRRGGTGTSYIVDGKENGVAAAENSLAVPQRAKHAATIRPSNPTPRCPPKATHEQKV